MSFLKPPELVETIENRKFLCFKWQRKVWYIDWEFVRLGPCHDYKEASATYELALATHEA